MKSTPLENDTFELLYKTQREVHWLIFGAFEGVELHNSIALKYMKNTPEEKERKKKKGKRKSSDKNVCVS